MFHPFKSALIYLPAAMVMGALLASPLFFAIPNPLSNPLLRELHDTGHVALFGGVQLVLLWLGARLRPSWHWQKLVLTAGLVSFGLGATIEAVQLFIDRNASLRDIWRNFLGITIASGLFLAWREAGQVRWLGVTLVLVCVPLALQALVQQAHTQWQRNQAFPQLMDFHNPATLRHTSAAGAASWAVVGAPPEWPPAGRPVARVLMPAHTQWPGLMLNAPKPNWSEYEYLSFDVFHPGEAPTRIALNIYCITKGKSTMYYRRFTLQPGLNQLRAPLRGRGLNPYAVRNLLWYSISEEEDLVLYFDDIRLE